MPIPRRLALTLFLLTLAAQPAAAGRNRWTFRGPDEAIDFLAIDRAFSVVYAGSSAGHLYRSSDRGQTWTPVPVPVSGGLDALAIPATAPETVYVAGHLNGLFKSTDGGASWTPASDGLSEFFTVEDLTIDPFTPSTLYAATSVGVFKSEDGAATWVSASVTDADGGKLSHTYTVAVDPLTPTTLFAGTVRGLFASFDQGGFWTRLDIPIRAVRVVAVEPSALYAYADSVLWKSTDGGASWEPTGLDERDLRDLAIDPASSAVLYAIGEDDVLRSTDGGVHWALFDEGLEFGPRFHRLAVAESNPPTLFLATTDGVYDIQWVTALELREGRFRVEVDWRDFANATGEGRVAVAGEDSGLFYFFGEDNWELLVKVLDGCRVNGRFWVFGAATTNVEYTLSVTDTVTGAVKTYRNPLGVASPAITDTQAFATCVAQ